MRQAQTNFLTTRQLARMWQVSEATIKRWADAGHLHSSKTLGGHRRFSLGEVMRFQNERGIVASVQAGLQTPAPRSPDLRHQPRPEQDRSDDAFFRAIMSGLEGVSTATLLKTYLSGVPLVRILDEWVAGSLRRVGSLWQKGEISVADEHLATRTAIRAIESFGDLIGREQAERERRAICCAVEDELHEVAALCVQVLLESEGWTVVNLGANTPFFALADAVKKHRPEMVCISSTSNLSLDRNAREYGEFHAVAARFKARIVLGGEGFLSSAIRQRFPADFHAENFPQLLEFLSNQHDEEKG